MRDGGMLKMIVDSIQKEERITNKTLRKHVNKYVSDRWSSEGNTASKVSYILSSMKKDSLTIKKFFEFYTIVGFKTLNCKIIMTSGGESSFVDTDVDLAMDKSVFGVNLKAMVDTMNIRHDISPARLSNHLSSWAGKNYPDMSTADVEHKAGNIAKSLMGTAITWRRLLDYFSVFEFDEVELEVKAEGELGESFVSIKIDLKMRIENDRRIREQQRRVKCRNKQNRRTTRGKSK